MVCICCIWLQITHFYITHWHTQMCLKTKSKYNTFVDHYGLSPYVCFRCMSRQHDHNRLEIDYNMTCQKYPKNPLCKLYFRMYLFALCNVTVMVYWFALLQTDKQSKNCMISFISATKQENLFFKYWSSK